MRFYNHSHRFYCGIDLHARTISLCVLEASGEIAIAPTRSPVSPEVTTASIESIIFFH